MLTEMPVENNHINAWSSSDNLNIIVDGLVLRGEGEMFSIEEDAVIWQSGQGEDNTDLHNTDLCYE